MASILVIVGASVRAAAQNAARAGYMPVCFDRFADADTARVAQVSRVAPYPASLPQAVAAAPPGPCMYTGAMENHLQVLAELARSRPLAGNNPAVLRRVRNPLLLAELLRNARLPVPDCTLEAQTLPRDGSYLRKPLHSGAGAGIAPWDEQCTLPPRRAGWYFQRRIDGLPCAAAYVAARGRARLLGLTQQRLSEGRCGGRFCFAGSVGPLELSTELNRQLARLGDVLAEAFGLVGWFGVDGILADGQFWTVEVNPRYTASAELYLRGLGINPVELHLRACSSGELPGSLPEQASLVHGKAILTAPCRLVVQPELTRYLLQEAACGPWPTLADIPAPQSEIPPGSPVFTVFASGSTPAEVHQRLDELLRTWQRKLWPD